MEKAWAERLITALRDDALARALVEGLVDHAFRQPANTFIEPAWLVDTLCLALTSAGSSELITRHVVAAWELEKARVEESGEALGEALPGSVRSAPTDPLPRPLGAPMDWVDDVVDPAFARELAAAVMTDALNDFVSLGLGRGKKQRRGSGGLFGAISRGLGELEQLGSSTLRPFISEFVQGWSERARGLLRDRLDRPESREAIAEMRRRALERVLAVPSRELFAALSDPGPETFAAWIHACLQHNLARPEIRAALEAQIAAHLDLADAPLGAWLQDLGVADRVRAHLVEIGVRFVSDALDEGALDSAIQHWVERAATESALEEEDALPEAESAPEEEVPRVIVLDISPREGEVSEEEAERFRAQHSDAEEVTFNASRTLALVKTYHYMGDDGIYGNDYHTTTWTLYEVATGEAVSDHVWVCRDAMWAGGSESCGPLSVAFDEAEPHRLCFELRDPSREDGDFEADIEALREQLRESEPEPEPPAEPEEEEEEGPRVSTLDVPPREDMVSEAEVERFCAQHSGAEEVTFNEPRTLALVYRYRNSGSDGIYGHEESTRTWMLYDVATGEAVPHHRWVSISAMWAGGSEDSGPLSVAFDEEEPYRLRFELRDPAHEDGDFEALLQTLRELEPASSEEAGRVIALDVPPREGVSTEEEVERFRARIEDDEEVDDVEEVVFNGPRTLALVHAYEYDALSGVGGRDERTHTWTLHDVATGRVVPHHHWVRKDVMWAGGRERSGPLLVAFDDAEPYRLRFELRERACEEGDFEAGLRAFEARSPEETVALEVSLPITTPGVTEEEAERFIEELELWGALLIGVTFNSTRAYALVESCEWSSYVRAWELYDVRSGERINGGTLENRDVMWAGTSGAVEEGPLSVRLEGDRVLIEARAREAEALQETMRGELPEALREGLREFSADAPREARGVERGWRVVFAPLPRVSGAASREDVERFEAAIRRRIHGVEVEPIPESVFALVRRTLEGDDGLVPSQEGYTLREWTLYDVQTGARVPGYDWSHTRTESLWDSGVHDEGAVRGVGVEEGRLRIEVEEGSEEVVAEALREAIASAPVTLTVALPRPLGSTPEELVSVLEEAVGSEEGWSVRWSAERTFFLRCGEVTEEREGHSEPARAWVWELIDGVSLEAVPGYGWEGREDPEGHPTGVRSVDFDAEGRLVIVARAEHEGGLREELQELEEEGGLGSMAWFERLGEALELLAEPDALDELPEGSFSLSVRFQILASLSSEVAAALGAFDEADVTWTQESYVELAGIAEEAAEAFAVGTLEGTGADELYEACLETLGEGAAIVWSLYHE